jgi:hypothetical protein
MQSRFLIIIGMAALQQLDGRTLVALTGGVRVPGRAAVMPLGAARESRRSLDRTGAAHIRLSGRTSAEPRNWLNREISAGGG